MSKIRFAETLRWLRKQAGLTEAQLAKILGCTEAAISTWELGKREPSFETLERLADLFCITPGDLINGLNGGKA